jgi:subtilisin family serine protease
VDFRVKPDAVAPGVNVLSSIPHQFCVTPPCFAFFQGTSMATPHLAGGAAVVRWAHPGWTAADVRSAIVNTSDRGVLKTSTAGTPATDVQLIGAGRENVFRAVTAKVALDPVSVSFGALPSGAGQTKTFDVLVRNLTGAGASYTVGVGAGDASVAYSVAPSSLTLGPGDAATVTVTMAAAQQAALGDHQATLSVSNGAEVAHAAVYTFVK